jgi:hypothetical protein
MKNTKNIKNTRTITATSPYDSDVPNIKMKLLASNTKLSKMNSDYLVAGLSLASHKLSGTNVCPSASPECAKLCINYSGQAIVYKKIIHGRINKTKLLHDDPSTFFNMLNWDLSKLDSIINGKYDLSKFPKFNPKHIAIRLNVFSDLPWEKMQPQLFTKYSHFQFYDYTKIVRRYQKYLDGKMPDNYHLTFSRSELNDDDCRYFLENYSNAQIAVVFKDVQKTEQMPSKYSGTLGTDLSVSDGDLHDLRFLDKGNIIGLRAKSLAKKFKNSPFLSNINTISNIQHYSIQPLKINENHKT